jgi:hypothetical protein
MEEGPSLPKSPRHGVPGFFWHRTGQGRRHLLEDISPVLRRELDVLTYLDASSDGIYDTVTVKGLLPASSPSGRALELKAELDSLFPELSDSVAPLTLSIDQVQRFRPNSRRQSLEVVWDVLPLRMGVLSTVSPIAYQHHAPIEAAEIKTRSSSQRSWQKIRLVLAVHDLEAAEIELLVDGVKRAILTERPPQFRPLGWNSGKPLA